MDKILIFSNGEKIGDGIIKLPFIYDLQKCFPKAELIWLTHGNTVYKNILAPLIKGINIKIYDNAKINFIPFKKISNKYDFKEITFDLIIDTQKTFNKSIALKKLKSKIFISSCFGWHLSDRRPFISTKQRKYYLENIYQLLELSLNYKLHKRSKVEVNSDVTKRIRGIFDLKKKYFGIAPGAGENEKKWPIEKYILLTKRFIEKGFTPCFFFGPQDNKERERIINIFGKVLEPEKSFEDISNVEKIMSSTEYLEFAVSNDSGISHMLSTEKCILFKIFNDKDPIKFTKYSSNILTISPLNKRSIDTIEVSEVERLIFNKLRNHIS